MIFNDAVSELKKVLRIDPYKDFVGKDNLDYIRSFVVEKEELGQDKIIKHKNKNVKIKIPQKIDKKVILLLRGLGKTKGGNIGNLLIYIWLNKGDDITKTLWLSETSAKTGGNKKILVGDTKIRISIPEGRYNGSTIRLRGLGREPSFGYDDFFIQQKKEISWSS